MKSSHYFCKTVDTDKEVETYLNDLVFLHEFDLVRVDAIPLGEKILIIALVKVTIQSIDPLATEQKASLAVQ